MAYVRRWWAVGCLWLALSAPASAVVIGFSPTAIDAELGGQFGVDIVVSQLIGPAGPEALSAFDIDVLYDATSLRATDFLFSDALGLAGLDSLTASAFDIGRIDLANISLLTNIELLAQQGNDVVLGRLLFDAIGIGSSLLTFDMIGPAAPNLVGLDPFASLPLTDVRSATVNVGNVSVPEPGSLLLWVTGLLGMALWRRGHGVES